MSFIFDKTNDKKGDALNYGGIISIYIIITCPKLHLK